MTIELHEVAPGVIVRDMLTLDDAIDLWLADLSRRGKSPRTRDSYRRTLNKLADEFPRNWDVARITSEDLERFLGQWTHRTTGTQNTIYSPVKGLFLWLYRTRRIKSNPMAFVFPPARKRPEDLDVVTVSSDEVRRMLAVAKAGPELIAMSILAYLGPRRSAVNALRLRDYDRDKQRLRFLEKGGKTIWKPVPDRLALVLEHAIATGLVVDQDDYLVPSRAQQRRPGDRDSRYIYKLVKSVAARAGVESHVHALRAAFACRFIEAKPGDAFTLQLLLGHTDPATTQIYLRRLDKTQRMEEVRDLAWEDNDEETESDEFARNDLLVLASAEKEGFEPSKEV